jgi:hypothetical protein
VTEAEDEAATVRAFVDKPEQDRWLLGLGKPARRRKLLDRLAHPYDWDPRYATEIVVPASGAAADWLADRLRERSAPDTCRVMGGYRSDGSTMPLLDAIRHCYGYGALLICLPGQLALHLPEGTERPVLLAC